MSVRPPGWLLKIINTDIRREKIDAAVERTFGTSQVYVDWDIMLGCGHYGCAFRFATAPYVLKITRDPTEGPMQAMVAARQKRGNYGFDGFAQVKGVFRMTEDISWRGKTWPVYVIVREEVTPLFAWLDVHERAGDRGLTYDTMVPLSPPTPSGLVHRAISGLATYQRWSRRAAALKDRRKKEQAEDMMADALRAISDGFPYIGEAMGIMQGEGTPLLDIHPGNIGVRTHEGMVDPEDPKAGVGAVVIFDPGHTPTDGSGEEIPRLNPMRPA